ncbi:MAG: tetraacyldisaccharide 4'-kinase, partial [Bacteroidales bacterium]|nr:tetraacyldisaccharide 4'-kinase [Bacteroidales bacterium]
SDSYRLVEQFHFPDHHRFTQQDIERVGEAARRHGTAIIITTQKDAQRMADIQKVPDILKSRTFYAPITAEFFTPQERESFRNFLLGALR